LGGLSSLQEALNDLYQVGRIVVVELSHNWDIYENRIPWFQQMELRNPSWYREGAALKKTEVEFFASKCVANCAFPPQSAAAASPNPWLSALSGFRNQQLSVFAPVMTSIKSKNRMSGKSQWRTSLTGHPYDWRMRTFALVVNKKIGSTRLSGWIP